MPHITDDTRDATWKAQLKTRIDKNIEPIIQDAYATYQRKVTELPYTTKEALLRLQSEYNQDIQSLRRMAAEELQVEIQREERERKWSAQTHWENPEDWNEALVHEQFEILSSIRKEPVYVSRAIVQQHNGTIFEQGSSSRPFTSRHRSSSSVGTSYSYSDPLPVQIVKAETPSEREARLRRENHEKQQEVFRKRAEAIQERKREEREIIRRLTWTDTMSSSSSTTSSDTHHEETSKALPPMNDEDVVNLIIFHDQQWTTITSLPHLQWTDFPWPVLSFESPKTKEELTPEAINDYLFVPLDVHRDRLMSKERLMEHIRKWHPDRFETKYLARIADLHEREMVREGAGVVARILNDILGKWNES